MPQTLTDPASEPRARLERQPSRLAIPARIVHGILSGVIGASVVAVLFLGIDVAQGRPLWTPHTLGSALFLGRAPAPEPEAVLVIGYTITHGAVFVSLGLLGATLIPLLSTHRGLLGFLGLFVLVEIVFLLFSALFADARGADLHLGFVSLANALAAAAMAGYFARVRGLDAGE